MPSRVPLAEINIALPWARPVPDVFWFDRKLRVWLSAQPRPAPLAIVISGTGSDGNTAKLSMLRGALYGAGYHVLTMPSPTFPGFIVSASSTGVAGDLMQDGHDLYAAMQQIIAHLPRKVRITDIDVLGYSLGRRQCGHRQVDRCRREGKLKIHRAVMINPPVSLFASIGRLDKLFAINVGTGDDAIERMYRRLYAELANLYRASDRVQIDEEFSCWRGRRHPEDRCGILGGDCVELPHRPGECVLRRRPVRRHRRRRRSEASAEGGRFARGDPTAVAHASRSRNISRRSSRRII